MQGRSCVPRAELGGAVAKAFRLTISNDVLNLILLPTEACNFRCIYCYENFRYRRMEPWVVRGIKALLTHRAPGLSSLSLAWFGGEPLLARPLIEDIMLHARDLAASHPAMRVSSGATTNGYLLTRPTLERLVELGVTNYQISFDGPKSLHDRKRVLAGGKGSYDRIWGNLLDARQSPCEYAITVRVHVDRENAHAIPQFIDDFARAFGGDSRFEIFIRGLSKLGGPNDPHLAVFDKREGDAVIESMRNLARSRGLRVMAPGTESAICYASKPNSFVVRANGRLNKCTVALEHENNQVGQMHEDGTMELRRDRMLMWMRGFSSGKPEELRCPMKGYADLRTVEAPELAPAP